MLTYKRILVPVDGSPTSDKALAAAAEIARSNGGRLRIIHAVDELQYLSGFEPSGQVGAIVRANADKVLKQAAGIAAAAGAESECELDDHPGERLGDRVARMALAWQADLIVVGTHGRRGVERVLMGSGAEEIIRLAPAPVLVIRAGQGA